MKSTIHILARLLLLFVVTFVSFIFSETRAENAYYGTGTSTGVKWSGIEWSSQAWVRMIKTDTATGTYEMYDYNNYQVSIISCPKTNYFVNLTDLSGSSLASGSSLRSVYGTASGTTAMVGCTKVTNRGSVFTPCIISVAPTGRGCLPQGGTVTTRLPSSCDTSSGIVNATFSTGSPSLPYIAWQSTDPGSACYYSCNTNYGGQYCDTLLTYAVIYNTNGGIGQPPEPMLIPRNTAIGTLPTPPSRTGYTFIGWYSTPTGGTLLTTGTVISSEVIYYARWTINTYTMTYDANGGTPATQTRTALYNTPLLALPPAPSLTHYTFSGWYTAPTGGSLVSTATLAAGDTTYSAQWIPETYLVTFNGNGGTPASTGQTVSYLVPIGTLPTPTRTGYTLSGWYTESTLGDPIDASTLVYDDTTYYAQWLINSYTVTYDNNGGTGVAPATQSVVYNTAIGTFPTSPTRYGYSFSGWYTASTGGTLVTTGTVITSANTYYAQWTLNSYTITFDGNGGTSSGRTVAYNTALGTLPSSTQTGYTFSGWYTAPAGGTLITTGTLVTGVATYYARWNVNSYIVTYNGNGGTPTTGTQSVVYNTTLGSLPANPTRASYTFSGWYTDTVGGALVTTGTVITSAKTYYAQWLLNRTVTFNGNLGSTPVPSSIVVPTGRALGSLPANPTRASYTFNGWWTATSGGTQINTGTIINANITYYAQWLINRTVTFNGNGGTGHSPGTIAVPTGTALGSLPTDPVRSGYTLKGWFTATSGGTQINTGTIISAAVTYYAQWLTNTTATFDGNGGTGHTPTTKTLGVNGFVGTLPSSPTRSGYSFSGWYTAATGGTLITPATVITGVTTYYAQWRINNTVTFDANGGTGHTPTTLDVGSGVALGTLPSSPTQTGYTFSGWYTASSGGTLVTTATVITGAVTYYAQWTINNYIVTYDGNGGTPLTSTQSIAYNTAIGSLPSSPVRTGHTFNGWYTASTGGTLVTVSDIITQDIVFYAQWIPIDYTVTFVTNGGSPIPSDQTVTYDTAIGTLPTVTQTGYTFAGWYTASGVLITSSTIVTDDVTYYTQWLKL